MGTAQACVSAVPCCPLTHTHTPFTVSSYRIQHIFPTKGRITIGHMKPLQVGMCCHQEDIVCNTFLNNKIHLPASLVLLWGKKKHVFMTRMLLSDHLIGHLHIFVLHVVVVLQDWWDVFFIIRKLSCQNVRKWKIMSRFFCK